MLRKKNKPQTLVTKTKRLVTSKVKSIRLVPRKGVNDEQDAGVDLAKKDNRGENNRGKSDHMRKIRSMRKFYGKQMPKLACNNCSFQNSCPKFRAGYECAFIPFLQSHEIKNEKDLMEEMKIMATANVQRMHMASAFETLSGSAPGLELTESMNGVFNQMKELYGLMMDVEETETALEESETVIGKLFGNLDNLVGSSSEAILELEAIGEEIATDSARSLDTDSNPEELLIQDMQSTGKDNVLELVNDMAVRALSLPTVNVTHLKI